MIFDELQSEKRKLAKAIISKVGLNTVIGNFRNILDAIWGNVFSMPKFDSYIKHRLRTCPGTIASIETLQGINELCEIRDFPDSYLLIRKLRDNLFLDLFLFEAQKTLENVPSETFKDINFNDIDQVIKALTEMHHLNVKKEAEEKELQAINRWKDGQLLMVKDKMKDDYFNYTKYISYIRTKNHHFNKCFELFLDDDFNNLGLKLNDFVHSNAESTLIYNQRIEQTITNIKDTLLDLEKLFLISLFFVDSTLLSSTDYMDYIEGGDTPPEGSQYWVNGYILEAFDSIKENDSELFNYLKSHNDNLMKID